jgi:hypothetical protein
MPIVPTPDLLQKYALKRLTYKGYQDAVDLYEDLRVHADGEMPKDVIEERRPSESERIKEYREKIYVPITEATVSKVITSLSKIRRSQDWSIEYDASKIPAKVAGRKGETLQDYCEKNYPYFKSITNWAFSVLLRAMCIDANAIEAIWPINRQPQSTEFLKPFATIFHSDQVLDYVMDDYAVLLSTDMYTYRDRDQIERMGVVIYVINTTHIHRWVQVDLDQSMREEWRYEHRLGYAPIRRLGGVFFRGYDNIFVYKSRIQGMVPRLKEAARIYSDLQAEIVQHVHSDKWLFSQTECRHCSGKGYLEDRKHECKSCNGVGYVSTSPYSNMVLRPQNNMEQGQVPTPPAGYIQKTDVALMVDRIDAQVDKQIYQALSAINMEFLAKAPLNESGMAKEVDKDELNNFVHSVAEDMVSAIDWTYRVNNDYRYKDLVPNLEEREGMLPNIPVPEKFDLLSSTLLLDDLAKAKQNGINPVIQNELQIEYAAKKFYNEPRVKNELEAIFELDPFPNISDEEKMTRLSNDGITQIDYVISSNIQQFVRRAMTEDPQFASKKLSDRKKVMEKYANEVIRKNSPAEQLLGGEGDDPASALRGSVGGLTGMIEIVKAVASGVYDLEAAIALVSQRFGISPEEARKQLGTPQIITDPSQVDKVAQLT